MPLTISICKFEPDVVMLTEIWAAADCNLNDLPIYVQLCTSRTNRQKMVRYAGGIATFEESGKVC
jgi:hypothetical protein